MPARFLIAGTLVGGAILSILNWLAAAILPPRYKEFKDPPAVVETIRANVEGDDIYTVPSRVFVALSLQGDAPQSFGPRIAGQFASEFAVALGLSLLLLMGPLRSPWLAAAMLGLAGLVAGIETHFKAWNWEGFPASHLLAGTGYLAANWFVTGLALGAVRRKIGAPETGKAR